MHDVISGANITIIGGSVFHKVTTATRLKKDLKKPDHTPRTYDQQPFKLDGRMDLDITFGEKTMRTPVYIKMDAHDQLLLCEGQQLDILTYHSDVQVWRSRRKRQLPAEPEVQVPTVSAQLVQSVQVPPRQQDVVGVRVDCPKVAGGDQCCSRRCLAAARLRWVCPDCGVHSPTLLRCPVEKGSVVALEECSGTEDQQSGLVRRVQTSDEDATQCKHKLLEVIPKSESLDQKDSESLVS